MRKPKSAPAQEPGFTGTVIMLPARTGETLPPSSHSVFGGSLLIRRVRGVAALPWVLGSPAPVLAIGLPLIFAVLTVVFLLWLCLSGVLFAALMMRDFARRFVRRGKPPFDALGCRAAP
jgi:hypothetical protein